MKLCQLCLVLVSVSLCKGWWLCLVIFKKQGSSNTCNHQDLVFNEWNLSNAPCPLPPLSIIPKGKGLLKSTSSRKISNLSSYRLQKGLFTFLFQMLSMPLSPFIYYFRNYIIERLLWMMEYNSKHGIIRKGILIIEFEVVKV